MFFKGAFLLFLICSPVILAVSAEDPLAASEAEIDDEDVVSDEGIVEEAEEKMKDKIVTELVNNEPDQEEAAIVDGVPAASKNVMTEVLFVQPHHTKTGSAASLQIAANKPVNMLVSFTNIETDSQQQNNDYKLDFIEGFLRYPSDYSYYLQNFTARPLDLLVEPKREATIEYSFTPALQLAGRPFGLTLRIGYHNNGGKKFTSTFFNETIQIVELDEGFDTESLFLYLLVAAVAGLAMFGGYHLLSTYALRKLRKAGPSKAVPEQQQPQQHGNIDLEWIPASHLKIRQSPTMSPRKRKSRRNDDNHISGH